MREGVYAIFEQIHSIYAKLGALVFVAMVYFFVPEIRNFTNSALTLLHNCDFEALRNFILSYGMLAPLTSIAIMALQSLVPLVPGVIITVANAWVFGWEYGALYSWLGALIGAMLDFGLARWYGRPIIEKLVNAKYLGYIDQFLKQHGVFAVFITRLAPIIPFKLVSYGSGLTAISFFYFATATAIGQTPPIILYSILGQYLFYDISIVLGATLLLITLAGSIFYCRHKISGYLKEKE